MMDKIDWSKAPEGAKYAAWVAGAVIRPYVCWYRIVDGGWHYLYEDVEDCWRPCGTGSPAHKPLIPRPQPDNKEGEGVEWEPGVDLPPVGVECEMQDDRGAWVLVEIISNIDGFSVGWRRDRKLVYFSPHAVEFRALKSHRDKVIEAAMKHTTTLCRKDVAAMYDAGMLDLPGDEQ